MAFPGFSNKKRNSISKGDFDRDGVSNRKDCEPLNFRKQDGGDAAGGMFDDADARVAVEENLWANYPDEAMAQQARARERDKIMDADIARIRKRQRK